MKYSKKELLADFQLAMESRYASVIGRKEVLTGKAKFGIFGDGKELPQILMAKVFKNGDIRSGYYRDQTFMMAINQLTLQQFFAQLYGICDKEYEPASSGRMMNNHFGTEMLDICGNFKNLTKIKNSASDVSPTGSQMPRLLGLAYASKLYRTNSKLDARTNFSINGNEIAFGTIGDASTSEGMFFEAINAAGVLQVPMLVSIWDDGYGISVSKESQTTKNSISKALAGFQRNAKEKGIEIFSVPGWDYEALLQVYIKAEKLCRTKHIPIIIHVEDLTQPLGHSTSGSHERYKSKERLQWEKEFDCINKFKKWILNNKIADDEELEIIEKKSLTNVKEAQKETLFSLKESILKDKGKIFQVLSNVNSKLGNSELEPILDLFHHDSISMQSNIKYLDSALKTLPKEFHLNNKIIANLYNYYNSKYKHAYGSNLFSNSQESALNIKEIKPIWTEDDEVLEGRIIIQKLFDNLLSKDSRVFFLGEDIGKIGGVNQGLAGLQSKYGENRVTDTGIRECTIVGQGIGCAMRGLKPIVEIQYLDYLNYALQIISDDLATLRYRTNGKQKAPLIIRTRGHRLEGIWHSGSNLSSILGAVRGVYVITPRNFVQACGFYNTMITSDDPCILIERLNAYRLKERVPKNFLEVKIPLGIPEIIRYGNDITIVTYGAMCDIALETASKLEEIGILAEVIDVQTLLPFDINKVILASIKKTNKVVFMDEDVPGGTTAYMMQQVLEYQGAFEYLECPPITISSKDHRPAYGDAGCYFSKPNKEIIFNKIYNIFNQLDPKRYYKNRYVSI